MSSTWQLFVAMPCMSNGVLPVVLVVSNWYRRPCTPTCPQSSRCLMIFVRTRRWWFWQRWLWWWQWCWWLFVVSYRDNCASAGCLSFGIVLGLFCTGNVELRREKDWCAPLTLVDSCLFEMKSWTRIRPDVWLLTWTLDWRRTAHRCAKSCFQEACAALNRKE